MATDQDNTAAPDGDGGKPAQQQQQPQSTGSEGHGEGSESVMKQMRAWEQRRASNSGRRNGSQ